MKVSALFIFTLLLAPAARAQQETFIVNPDASSARITLKTTHEVVNGTFHLQSGSIMFDRSVAKMAGSVIVLAGSGDTGNGSRDKKMKKEILKVEQYATVSFVPRSYSGTLHPTGDSAINVSGDFTLLGTAHEVTVPVMVHLEDSTASVQAHFVIPYINWGLKDPSFLFWKADKEVTVDLSLKGRISP